MWWTLAASIVGSGTALFIACVVYPWQKSIDRSHELASEKRAVLRDLVSKLSDTDLIIRRPDEFDSMLGIFVGTLHAYGESGLAKLLLEFSRIAEKRVQENADAIGAFGSTETRSEWLAHYEKITLGINEVFQ